MAQAAHIRRFTAKPDSTDELVAVFARALPYILEVSKEPGDPGTGDVTSFCICSRLGQHC